MTEMTTAPEITPSWNQSPWVTNESPSEALSEALSEASTKALPEVFTHHFIQHVIDVTTTTKEMSETTRAQLIRVNVDDGSFEAIIGGSVVAIILMLLCLAVLVLRYMFKHKGTYHTNESEDDMPDENADSALPRDQALLETVYEE